MTEGSKLPKSSGESAEQVTVQPAALLLASRLSESIAASGELLEQVKESPPPPAEQEAPASGNLAKENLQLRSELLRLQRELDEAKSEVAVSAFLQENLNETERQRNSLAEELATMQALLVEAADGNHQENQLGRLQHRYHILETENRDLKLQLRLNEGRHERKGLTAKSSPGTGMPDRDTILGGAAVLTDKTKSMVRKMKSSVVQSVGLPTLQGSTSPEEELKRAQDDSELLRSIVLPLEEQIVALKGKLRETDSLLQEYEKRQATSLVEMEVVASWLQGEDKQILEDKLREAVGDGYQEAGQLYHAMLAARIGMLSHELQAAKWEREELASALEAERKEMAGLRNTLENATPAARAERSHYKERIHRLKSLLTDEQKEEYNNRCNTNLGHLAEATNCQSSEADQESQPAVTRIVSEADWLQLQSRLDGGCATTHQLVQTEGKGNSEEVERLRASLKEVTTSLTRERDHLAANCEKYKEDLGHEAAFRKEMESTWNSRGVQYRAEVAELERKLKLTEQAMEKIAAMYKTLVETSRRDLKTLTQDREQIVRELKRLQEENDNLVGKHSSLASTMANEVIDLPSSPEDMQLLLLNYREDLIAAKIAKERAEERMKSEVAFMRSQLTAEQQAKLALEDQLTSEIQFLRERLRILERAGLELDQEKERRRSAEHRVRQLQQLQNETSIEASKQVEAVKQAKHIAENQVMELRNKVASLQADLDNSVAVQNDFVRLSQSLQVELEKIRQAEKEVRWQFDEDVEECNSCRLHFSGRKKKANCRHCGRIFCPDCLSKQVSAGPSGRQCRVCDVCHTLLVQNSAPYFSMEAPHIE